MRLLRSYHLPTPRVNLSRSLTTILRSTSLSLSFGVGLRIVMTLSLG